MHMGTPSRLTAALAAAGLVVGLGLATQPANAATIPAARFDASQFTSSDVGSSVSTWSDISSNRDGG